MRPRTRALCALILLQAGPVIASAQEQRPVGAPAAPTKGSRFPRSLLFAGIGGVAAAAVSGVYAFTENDNSSPGQCTSGNCVLTVATMSGALVGFMIGKELDQLHTLRYRGGMPLYPRGESIGLAGDAFVLAVRDTMVAIAGRGGVQIISSGSSLKLAEKRASGIRGITALDLVPGNGSIALGSPSGFYLYPPRTGPGMLLREGETSTLVATPERVYFSTGTRIESAPVGADTLRSWPGIDVGARPLASAYDEARGLLWVVTDTTLLAFRPEGDSLTAVGRTRLPARARTLAVEGALVAVSLGEGGVVLYDVSDAASARERGRWNKARFVYSVSLAGDRLFAAGGMDGVYVLSVTKDGLETFGLARELGFATLLTSRGRYTYMVDRTTNSLRRIPSAF